MFKRIFKTATKHKIITGIIILLLIGGGYFGYRFLGSNKGETRYVLTKVEKGTIIVSVTGSGQVSAVNETTIKPKISGDLIYLPIEAGQTVSRGQLIAKIDTSDAEQAIQNAQKALDQANLDLEKMNGIETSLGRLRGVKEKAEDDLAKVYEDGFNTVTNTFLNLPTIMTGLQSILFDYTLSKNSQNIDYYADGSKMYNPAAPQYKANAYNSYQTARTAYDKNFNDYKITNRFSSPAEIESIISETYETLKNVSTAVKDTINLIQLYQDELTKHEITPNTTSATHLSNLSSYTNTTNSYLSSLLSTKTTIETNKENLIETDYDIADQESLVADKQTALDEANKNLSYCSIYSPFNGVISEVDVKNGDSVSTGTTIAKIVTKETIAEISLNEIDAAKVKIGQKATITFDAISNLTLTGQVFSIDTVGTVSQGVVSYAVKINFDTQDDRVKPGMSVSVAVITDSKQNVLVVANSAVKSQGNTYYVEMFDQKFTDTQISQGITSAIAPKKVTVQTGISDDSQTEIISGISEGDQIVTKTTTGKTTTTKTTTTNSILNVGRGGAPRD
jgi:HlyD family secretion protein